MRRRVLPLALLFATLLTSLPFQGLPIREIARAAETKECTVYVTRTGTKYHQPTCFYLRYSRRAMPRSEALAAGYTPCKRCGGSDCE